MLKKIAYLLIATLILSIPIFGSGTPIAPNFKISDAGDEFKKASFSKTQSKTVAANGAYGYYFELTSNVDRNVVISVSDLVKSIDMDDELNQLSLGDPFIKTIANVGIQNNTQDGFIVAVFAQGPEEANGATDFVFVPTTKEDGEVAVPYFLDFSYTNGDGEQIDQYYQTLPNLGGAGATDGPDGTIAINSEIFTVIMSKTSMTEPLDGTLKIDLRVEDADQLRFAGEYSATNKFAFVDL